MNLSTVTTVFAPGRWNAATGVNSGLRTEELRSVVLIAAGERVHRDAVSPPGGRNASGGVANAGLDVHCKVCSFPERKGRQVSGLAERAVGEHDGGTGLCGRSVSNPLEGIRLSEAR